MEIMGLSDQQEKHYGTYADNSEDEKKKKVVGFAEKLFPTGFKAELKRILFLAWPVALCSLFTFSLGPVALIFSGHIGKDELDAVALANSMLNVTGIFICVGLSTSCDTLFSQAFGGQHMKLIGIYLQRGLILMTLACVLCWSIHLNAEPLFLALGQNPTVSKLAAEYMVYFMPGLMFNFWFQVLVKFLHSQNIILASVLVTLFGNVVNVLLQYMLVFACSLGTRGSATGQAISWLSMVCALMIYIVRCGVLKDTWPGWSLQVLEDWGMFCKLAIAGLLMIATEWCAFEVGIFMSGTIGVVEQASISVLVQIETLQYMITLGFGIACSIRVGQNLGAGKSDGAKTSYRVSQLTNWLVIAVVATLVLILRHDIAWVFTKDQKVADSVSDMIPYDVIIMVLDTLTGIPLGVLRGCGLQWIGGILNFIGYVVIAIPVIYLLVFVADVGIKGFWWALAIGIFPVSVIYIIIVHLFDWEKQSIKAMHRNEKSQIERSLVDKDTVTENIHTEDNSHSTKSYKRSLIRNRIIICVCVIAVFFAGVILRVCHFIPTTTTTSTTTTSEQSPKEN